MEALDRESRERLPLAPGRRLVALELLDELGRHEVEVEYDRLVVAAVAHPERDERSQAEVAVGLSDGAERLLAEALELVEEIDDRGRARADHLHAAEQRAHVDLARRVLGREQHGV